MDLSSCERQPFSRFQRKADRSCLSLTDDNGSVYTTTIYSTQSPSSPTSPTIPNTNPPNTNYFGTIIAGAAGGVGILLLLVGFAWFIWIRRAKRRAGMSSIKDRKFYPDRYNQTVAGHRHSKFNEIEPGPVIIQPPPPPPFHQTPCPPSGPLSRRTSSYHDYIPSSHQTRVNWVGAPPMGGVSGSDVPPLPRHRFPYPSSPQPLADRYTMLPESSPAPVVDIPTAPLRFAPSPAPRPPHHFRSSSFTHRSRRSHRSHHSHHSRSHHLRSHAEHDSYFPPIPIPNPPPLPRRMTRRTTVFISPPMSPSSFSVLSGPPPDLPATEAEQTTITLTSQPSITGSTFSSINPLVVVNEPKRMTCTNPDSDADLDTDAEPSGSSRGGGSPSTTDIIQLYDRD